MKTITTKYLGPTDFKGSRVKATDGDGNQVTLSWDSSLDSSGNHKLAAQSLCQKMGWQGEYRGGHLVKAGATVGMVWVAEDTLPDMMFTIG